MAGKLRIRPSMCFEIEKVIGVSIGTGNVRTYQVQWAPAWVSGLHLVGCEHLIEEFLQKQHEEDSNMNSYSIVEREGPVEENFDGSVASSETPSNSGNIAKGALLSHHEDGAESQGSDLPNANTTIDVSIGTSSRTRVNSVTSMNSITVKEEEGSESDYNTDLMLEATQYVSHRDYEDEYLSHETNTAELFQSNSHPKNIHGGFSGVTMCAELNSYTSYGNNMKEKRKKCSESDRYKCDDCGKTFKFRYLLRRHMPVHIDGLRFRCKYCDKSYARKDSLTEHLMTHTAGIHQSEDGSYSFLERQDSPPLKGPDLT